jgi:hypothetical protein
MYTIPAGFLQDYSVMASVRVDSQDVHTNIHEKKDYQGEGSTHFVNASRAVVAGKSFKQKLRFSELETCEHPPSC